MKWKLKTIWPKTIRGRRHYSLRLALAAMVCVAISIAFCKPIMVRRNYYEDALQRHSQDGYNSFWTSSSLRELYYFDLESFPLTVQSAEYYSPSLISCTLNSPQRFCVTVSEKSLQGPVLRCQVNEEVSLNLHDCELIDPCFPSSTVAVEFGDCIFKSSTISSCWESGKVKTLVFLGGEFPHNFQLNLSRFPALENIVFFGLALTNEMCNELENTSTLKFVSLSRVRGVDREFAQRLAEMSGIKRLDLLNCIDSDGRELMQFDGDYRCELRFKLSKKDDQFVRFR